MPHSLKILFVIFLSLFFAVQLPISLLAKSNSGSATLLIYHKFGEDRYPTTNVALERFEEQMQYLFDNNFNVLPLSTLVQLVKEKKQLPEKSVAITIDDGYMSVYEGAWPILKKYNYPFTVFLYVKAIDRRYRDFLTWDIIKEMQQAGVDFQDHSYSHHRFGSRPSAMSEQDYRKWIKDDLVKGSTILSRNLGQNPSLLALPYGEYNSIVLEEASKLGYEAVFSQDPGSVSLDYNVSLPIPREPILGNEWASMDHFKMILKRQDLPLSNCFPSIKPFVDTKPEHFCADLTYPDRYKPGTFGIYVSEVGWQKGELNQGRLCVPNVLPLQRRSNRVAVSAIEKGGRTAIRYWLLIQ